MKPKPLLFAVACTLAVLSAPAQAMGVVNVSAAPAGGTATTVAAGNRQAVGRAQPQSPANDDDSGHAPAVVVAAMVMAAVSIGRRMR